MTSQSYEKIAYYEKSDIIFSTNQSKSLPVYAGRFPLFVFAKRFRELKEINQSQTSPQRMPKSQFR